MSRVWISPGSAVAFSSVCEWCLLKRVPQKGLAGKSSFLVKGKFFSPVKTREGWNCWKNCLTKERIQIERMEKTFQHFSMEPFWWSWSQRQELIFFQKSSFLTKNLLVSNSSGAYPIEPFYKKAQFMQVNYNRVNTSQVTWFKKLN